MGTELSRLQRVAESSGFLRHDEEDAGMALGEAVEALEAPECRPNAPRRWCPSLSSVLRPSEAPPAEWERPQAADAYGMRLEARRDAGEILKVVEVLERELYHAVDVGSSFDVALAREPSSGVLEGVRVDEVLEVADLGRRRRRLEPV